MVILTGDQLDEIDIELLGGDEKHWQTNVFAPSRRDPKRHYGVFSAIDKVPASSDESPTIEDYHTYSIDWNKERIIWSIDGKTMRTLSAGMFPLTCQAYRGVTAFEPLREHANRRLSPLPNIPHTSSAGHLGCK